MHDANMRGGVKTVHVVFTVNTKYLPRNLLFGKDSIMPCAVKFSFKFGLRISLSLEINNIDFYISFDKNWFSRFKSQISSF
jgi:hypothetical protein